MIQLDLDVLKLFHQSMKLGKKAPKRDLHLLPLSLFTRKVALPNPAEKMDWYSKVPQWGMMRNDVLGDCTCAGVGHAILQWTTYTGKTKLLSDDQIVQLYSKFGYTGTSQTDNGCVETDVLNYWKENGVFGDKLDSYVSVNPLDQNEIKDAISWFGNVYTGIALPKSAQNQQTWDIPSGGPVGDGAPDSWGGHCVIFVGYDEKTVTMVTWGGLKQATWGFVRTYMDECYALLNQDFLDVNGKAPSGMDWGTLQSNLRQI